MFRCLIHDGFILPFRNFNLLGLYLGAFLGVFGIVMLEVFLAFNLAGLGMGQLLEYLLARFALINLVLMPLGFSLLRRHSRRMVIEALSIPAIPALLLLVTEGPALPVWMAGVCQSFVACPFWLMYHLALMTHCSDSNRGNEVGIAFIWLTLGSFAGGLAAGGLSLFKVGIGGALFFGAVVQGTALLLKYIYCHRSAVFSVPVEIPATARPGLLQVVTDHPRRSWATFIDMLQEAATSTLWPVWLKVVGATGLAAGALYALNIGLRFVLSPVVGRIVNSKSGLDAQIGPAVKMLGWIPWLFSASPLTSVWSSLFFAAGTHMFKVGLESRWYETKSYEHMAAREILLGSGRLCGIIILVPILFYTPEIYIWSAILLTMVLMHSGMLLRQSMKPDILTISR